MKPKALIFGKYQESPNHYPEKHKTISLQKPRYDHMKQKKGLPFEKPQIQIQQFIREFLRAAKELD